mgnify:CR=1 FL=1
MNGEIVKSEMKRYITEALMVNPYIKKLEKFLILRPVAGGMKVTFDCTSIYGERNGTDPNGRGERINGFYGRWNSGQDERKPQK